jgi:nucleotide-binding universal stress UspA family protein
MKVLCAVDGSPDSHQAIETLQGIGVGRGSTLELLYVIDTTGMGTWAGMELFEIPEDRGGAIVERVAREYVSSRWRAVRTKVLRGNPAEIILRRIHAEWCDLVVVGCRGVTDYPSFLLGSVSRRVVLYAPCAVLVAKKPAPRPRLAVVGMDGSPDAWASVEFLCRLPLAQEIEVIVATVIPPLPIPPSPDADAANAPATPLHKAIESEAARMAGKTAERLRKAGYHAMVKALRGPVGATIVNLAESARADLVVVGSHGLTGRGRFLMGGVSETVATYASCSVLVFRSVPGSMSEMISG